MKTQLKGITIAVALGIGASLFTLNASACSMPSLTNRPSAGWEMIALPAGTHAASLSAAALPAARVPPVIVDIVGLWKFTYVAEGNGPEGPPDGAIIDSGFQTWHSDGTELMNSGRVPSTGNFCQGVWAQSSWYTYRLNHWALSWDFDPVSGNATVFVGPTNIKENLVMDLSGNKFDGTFSITQYAPDSTTVLGGVKGSVTAVRITVD
ncbi:MAG: hypothetical protein ABI846_07680 [Rudaea sp.]